LSSPRSLLAAHRQAVAGKHPLARIASLSSNSVGVSDPRSHADARAMPASGFALRGQIPLDPDPFSPTRARGRRGMSMKGFVGGSAAHKARRKQTSVV